MTQPGRFGGGTPAGARGSNAFTRQLGPLPVWGWMGIGLAVALGYYFWTKNKAKNSPTQGTDMTQGPDQTTASSQIPQFVVEDNAAPQITNITGPLATSSSTSTTPPAAAPPPPPPQPAPEVRHGDCGQVPHRVGWVAEREAEQFRAWHGSVEQYTVGDRHPLQGEGRLPGSREAQPHQRPE